MKVSQSEWWDKQWECVASKGEVSTLDGRANIVVYADTHDPYRAAEDPPEVSSATRPGKAIYRTRFPGKT